jgi:hypothetical protein
VPNSNEPAAAPPAKPPAVAADPANSALTLQQRLAGTGAVRRDPLAEAIDQATMKASRRELAIELPAVAPPAEPEPVAAAPTPAPTPAPAPEPEPGDPREQEEWFQRLPAAERERLSSHWRTHRERFADEPIIRRQQLIQAAWHGAVVFLVLGVLLAMLYGFGPLLPLVGAGGLAAMLAQAAGGGRFVFSAGGVVAYLAVMGPLVIIDPFGMLGAVIAAYGLGVLGIDREIRRSGGFGRRG